MKTKLIKLLPFLPFLVFAITVIVVFKDFFLKGLLPIPLDILVGAYFPWLDYKWGYVVGVPVQNPAPSDVISILYPWRLLGINILKTGQLPLWDPTILLGTPLLANFQSALLNPLNFLFFVLPEHIAWSIQVISQSFLIASFMYLYLRNLNLNKWSATLGGLSLAFCGFSIVWMEYNTIGFCIAFIPLIFLLTDKLLQTKKMIWGFLLSLSICLQIFSGYPQLTLYTLFFVGIYFLYRLYLDRSHLTKRIILFSLSCLAGISLAAIQIIPSLELLNLSIRNIDNVAAAGNIQFLPLKHLLTFFVPDFFGNPATGNYWGVGTYDNFAFFISTVAIFFFVLALFTKKIYLKPNLIFVIILLISLIASTVNPLNSFLVKNGLFGLKSAVAARNLIFFDFSAIVIASIGFQLFLENQKRSIRYFYPLTIFVGIGLGLVICIRLISSFPVPSEHYKEALEMLKYTQISNKIALKNLVIPFGIMFVVTILAFIKTNKTKKYIAGLILLILMIDVTRSANKYLSFTPSSFLYPNTKVTESLQKLASYHRFDKERGEILPANTWTPYDLKSASGQNPLYQLSTSKYISLINNGGKEPTGRFVDIKLGESPLFNTLDIETLALINRDEKESTPNLNGIPFKYLRPVQFKDLANIGTVRIYQNTTNLGLAWFSKKNICIQDEQKAFSILSSSNYNPSELMVVNCEINSDLEVKKIGKVQVESESYNLTKLQTTSAQDNYLHISKSIYPGWKAFIDGKETPLLVSNTALMAIEVPHGTHNVEIKYQPKSFYLGILISVLTLLGWIIIMAVNKLFSKNVKNKV